MNVKKKIKKFLYTKYKILYTKCGFTLIETLVVLSVFSILSVLVTSIIIYSLRGTRKSENTSKVRAQLNDAIEVIERQLRNAKSIESVVDSGQANDTLQKCSGSGTAIIKGPKPKIFYTDQFGQLTYFECIGGTDGIASGSASIKLANQSVTITACSFSYTNSCDYGVPENVTFKIIGNASSASGPEAASVSVETNIQLRNYK